MASAFDYITIHISIILRLGITQILAGIVDVIQQSNRVKVYCTHGIWVLLVLVMHMQD